MSTPTIRSIRGGSLPPYEDPKLLQQLEGCKVEYEESEQYKKFGWNLLHFVACLGQAELIPHIMWREARMNIEGRDSSGMTPLQLASRAGHADAVRKLLDHRADIETKDDALYTPLHQACFWSRLDVVDLLLRSKADVNAKSKGNETPLHLASCDGMTDYDYEDRLEIVKLLLKRGAAVNIQDKHGETPLAVAERTKQDAVCQLLKQHGATCAASRAGTEVPSNSLAIRTSNRRDGGPAKGRRGRQRPL